MDSVSPIFVVGTGRCGTTLLLKMFSRHPALFAPPLETRFIVDPDGVMDLVNDLTVSYSVTRAREALYRFEQMMRIDLACAYSKPYLGYDLPAVFGDGYWPALNRFCDQLCIYDFAGDDFPLLDVEPKLVRLARLLEAWRRRLSGRARTQRAQLERRTIREPRYFADRQELLALVRAWLGELFGAVLARTGKSRWVEKTPHSLLHLDFLLDLFPQAQIVHVKRDPQEVLNSYTRQTWAPAQTADASRLLSQIYERWMQQKAELGLAPDRYIEIRLEDLVAQPLPVAEQLETFLGLSSPLDCSLVQATSGAPAAHGPAENDPVLRYREFMGYREP